MAAPDNFTDVSWYKFGTVPGNKGSAVMAGHEDNAISLPGVFYDLHKLEKIFNRNDGSYLNLITCAGEWLASAKTNDKRLVIYAKLVE